MSQDSVAPPRHSRKALYIPFIIVGIALVAWTGWWFFLTHEVKSQLRERLDRLQTAGWTVQYDHLRASGWPLHARISMDDVTLVSPAGIGIQTPRIAAEANSYNPQLWVIGIPDQLTLVRGDKGNAVVTSPAMRMSLSGLRQKWPNVAIEIQQPQFASAEGAEPFPLASAALIQLYMRPYRGAPPSNPDDVDMLFRLIDAKGRAGGPVEGFAQGGDLTVQIETVIEKANALRRPSHPAGVLAGWTDAGGRFTKVRGEMQAGVSHGLLTSPALSANADGRLEGTVTFRAEEAMAAIAGLARTMNGQGVDPRAAQRAASTQTTTEDAETIELTVNFQKGRTYLGPFAMAPAPKLF